MHKLTTALLCLLPLLLSACASTTGIYSLKDNQNKCEQNATQFTTIFECTKQRLQADTSKPLSESAELYILKGEQLKEKVAKNEMTDLDAKFEWQKLYVELHNKHREFQQNAFRSRWQIGYGWRSPYYGVGGFW